MQLAMIGVGQGGGKVLDTFLEYDDRTRGSAVRAPLAVNTASADLMGLEQVPERRRILIGQSRVKGHGVGADNELGAEIAEEDIDELQSAINDVPTHEIDAFLIVAALGGGTGSGAAPVIAKHLKTIYAEPVYGLGILPGNNEGGIYTLNAARSFQTFTREVDNLMVFDNDAWRETGESVETGFKTINEELVRRLGLLFGAGAISDGPTPESVVDSSEIINTLASGGVSSIGYAVDRIDRSSDRGLLARFGMGSSEDVDAIDTTNRITSLVRKATLGRLTLPCELEGVERALVVVAGPPEYLNRKGIERGRKWVEEQTGSMEVRGGDFPLPEEDDVAVIVMLSGLTDVPRVKELQQVAVEAMQNIEEIRAESEGKLEGLISEDADDLEPLF
ncbi:MAG: cell division GTPase FtsZ [Natrialbaceae archaeon]|jgi:cell division GTPase FtsZ